MIVFNDYDYDVELYSIVFVFQWSWLMRTIESCCENSQDKISEYWKMMKDSKWLKN